MDKQPSEQAEQVETLTPLLAVDDLFCERDERVLFQNLSFRLDEGQVLQIKGGNGSGKTTLLRILCGLNDNYQGLIRWRGELLANCVEEFRDGMLYLDIEWGQQGAHSKRKFTVVRSSAQTNQRGRDGCGSCAGRSSGF